jgi:4'-phosphopantetheinyl transferase
LPRQHLPSPLWSAPDVEVQLWQSPLPLAADEADTDATRARGMPPLPDGLLPTWQACLSADERTRAARFHFVRDQVRFTLARALLREVLGRLSGQAPAALRFGQGPQGKPFLMDETGQDSGLAFNLSHTDDLVLLAVHRDGLPLGVDVESTQRRAPLAVVRRQFAPVEADALEALVDPSAQVHHFWSCWTLKESLIKATGEGLHTPLSRFGFVLRPEGRIDLQAQAGTPEGDTPWWFGQWRPSPQHLAALCVAVAPGASCAPPRLQAWQGWPGETLAPLPVTWLARSAG